MKELKKFNVTICYDGAISYNIAAENEEQAKERAIFLFKREDDSAITGNIYNTEPEVGVKNDKPSQDLTHGICFSYVNLDKEIIDVHFKTIEDFVKSVDFGDPELNLKENMPIDLSLELESMVFDVSLGSEENIVLQKQDIKNIRDLYEVLAEQYGPQKNKHYEVELYRDGNFVTSRCIVAPKKPTIEKTLELLKDDMNKFGCDTISNPYNLPFIDYECSLDNENPDEWVRIL